MRDYADISLKILFATNACVSFVIFAFLNIVDALIVSFALFLWAIVLIETAHLMLPESDEPHDWQ